MGASGPTLKPNVLVTNDSNKSGNKYVLLDGRDLLPLPEKMATKSATVKVDELNSEDKIPISNPPQVQSPVMK